MLNGTTRLNSKADYRTGSFGEDMAEIHIGSYGGKAGTEMAVHHVWNVRDTDTRRMRY